MLSRIWSGPYPRERSVGPGRSDECAGPGEVQAQSDCSPVDLPFAFLGLASPTVINYAPYGLSWDPAYYLHNALCMNHAVYDFSLSGVTKCLSITAKGPIMELLGLPWGRVGGTYWGVGLAFVALGLFVWTQALATYLTCIRSGIPLISLLPSGCYCLPHSFPAAHGRGHDD